MADDLIARLREGGEAGGTGAFTLDPVRARAKLREFQLADPFRYVLLLVQALALRGATRIDAEIDADDVTIHADAEPFTSTQLEDLYLLLFADGAAVPGLRELALGLNAAMATDPQYVRIECGGAPGVVLEQRNDAPDRVTPLPDARPGIHIVVHQRFSLGIVRRFFVASRGKTREHTLLREHCGFAGIPIHLGGEPVPRSPLRDDLGVRVPIHVDGRPIGELGLSHEGAPGRLELVRHHVWLRSHQFEDVTLRGVHGVVDVSHLRTDASMTDVVRDADYDAVLAAAHAARDLALAHACLRHPEGRGFFAGPMREVLCHRIAAHLAVPSRSPGESPLREYLALPLWFDLRGAPRTTAEVLARRVVRYTELDTTEVPEGFDDVLFAAGRAGELVRFAFGRHAASCTNELRRALLAAKNRRELAARVHRVALPAHTSYDVVRTFTGDGDVRVEGVIGWCPNLGPSWIRIVVDDRLLVELPLVAELSTVHVVISAPFRPDAMCADVMRDSVFAAAMHAALAAFAQLVRDVCLSYRPPTELPALIAEDLLRYVIAVVSGTHANTWLQALGLAESSITELCAARGRPWALDARSLAGAHPFAQLELFTDASGKSIDLACIAAAFRAEGRLRVVTLGRPLLEAPPFFVVRVGALRVELLEAIHGKARIHRVGAEYETWIARQRLAAVAPSPLASSAPCVVGPVHYTASSRPCLAGVHIELPASDATNTEVRVLVEGRSVTTMTLDPALRGLELVVDLPETWLGGDLYVLRSGAKVLVRELAAAGVGAVLDALLGRDRSIDDRLAALVLDAAMLAFPTPALLRAWTSLHALAPDERVQRYVELLRLGDRLGPGPMSKSLDEALSGSDSFDVTALRSQLRRPLEGPATWSAFPIEAARRLPGLLAIPVLPTAGSRRRSLGEAIDEVARTGSFGYLTRDTRVPAEFLDVPFLDTPFVAAMLRLLGAQALRNRAAEVAAATIRTTFQRRTPLRELVLPPGAAVVSIVVELDGIQGVLGVPPIAPGEGPGRIMITNTRRPITTIDAVSGTAWVGILDGEGFGEEQDFQGLTDRECERVAEIVATHRPMIVAALCAAGLDDDDGTKRRWVQHLMHQCLPLGGCDRAALDRAGVPQLALLPLFVDAEGRGRTLLELRAACDTHRSLAIVRRAGLVLDRMLVHVRDGTEYDLLRHLFGELEDAEPAALRRAAFAQTIAGAPALPTVPADAFVVEPITGRGLEGAVWLADEATPAIVLGMNGRAVTTWTGSTMFPCSGAVTGEGVTIRDDFAGCEMTRAREDHVKSAAARLYLRLVADMRPDFAPPDDPRSRLLRALLLRLHDIRRENRQWPSHDMRRLYRELEGAPLLPLASGRVVSLRTALKAQPAEVVRLLRGEDVETHDTANDRPPDDATPVHPEPIAAAPIAAAPVAAAPLVPAPPVVPPPDPAAVLRERVVAELRLLHRRDLQVVTEAHLDALAVAELDGRFVVARRGEAVILDSRHPVVRRALTPDVDPLLVSIVASSALTALNLVYAELTDADEARLLRLHAELLTTSFAAGT